MSPMREIRLEKVTLNMGAGDSAQRLEASKKVLTAITGRKVVVIKTVKRSTFGTAKGRPMGVKVTLRGKEAEEMLGRLMKAVENRIKPSYFDSSGNFSFGIKEYIHIPGASYDPDIGILGLDAAVTLERPGFRVKKRKSGRTPIGRKHAISPEESMEWARKFGFTVTEEEEKEF